MSKNLPIVSKTNDHAMTARKNPCSLKKILFGLGILACILGSQGQVFAQKLNSSDDRLSIPTMKIQTLFALQKDSPVELQFVNQEGKQSLFNGKVLNHTSQGPTSGVLSILLQHDGNTYKLLMSRKTMNGKLQYLTQMIQSNGPDAFKLMEEKGELSIFVRTAKNNIVTP